MDADLQTAFKRRPLAAPADVAVGETPAGFFMRCRRHHLYPRRNRLSQCGCNL